MSTLSPGVVVCHRCQARFDAQLWTGLHATRAPEVREAVLDGTFHRFECRGCGELVFVEPTMLYTDFDRRQWVAVLPEAGIRHRTALARLVEDGFHHNMEVACPPMVKAWAPSFVRRLVFGLPALRDKLLAWDAGLDDRVLELYKLQVLRDQGVIRPDTRLWLDAVEPERLVFNRVEAQPAVSMELVRRYGVERAGYDRIYAERQPYAVTTPALFSGIVVDWRAPWNADLPLDAQATAELAT